jgi:hypothetical protein
VAGKTLAIVGVSGGGKGFGNAAYSELEACGYRVLPIHQAASTIQGDPCWRSLAELPERVERLVVVVNPAHAEAIVREAAAAGVRQIWLQQGAESVAALQACEQLGVEVVHGQCILMFTDPVGSIHRFHRWLWKVLRKIPE